MLRKIYRILYRNVVCARNPVKYARKVGINLRGGGRYISMGRSHGELNRG